MATALGPEGAAPIPIMGESQGHFAVSEDSPSTSPDPQASPRPHAPLPNPAFSFPARLDAPSSAPSSFSRASGRRPMSALTSEELSFSLPAEDSENQRRSVALPAFSFNPGASLPSDLDSPPLLSPPITPNSPRTSPTGASQQRPAGHGHRRGGSEFVGGRLREGNSIAVMSTSPTKPESGFASPSFQPPRRGHRRGVSSAISTNDLPILLPPPIHPVGKGNSAPNSPTNFEQDYMSLSGPELSSAPPAPRPVSRHQPDDTAKDTEEPAPKDSPKQPRSGTRARVGFSDTLEYIPRPLSMVSSDTSSTATARPGHSVSESLSSVMSASPGRDSPAPLSRSPTRDMVDSRPSTAGAILEGFHDPKPANGANLSPRRRNSIPALLDVADSSAVTPPTPSPTKSKRWSFFGLEPFTGSGSPTKRPSSSSSTDSTPRAVSAGSSSEHGSDSLSEPVESAPSKHKKSAKKSKKKRKVKGWAGAILPRKPKSQAKRSKDCAVRPPTPPASIVPPEDEDEEVEQEPQIPAIVTPTVTVTESATPPRRSKEDASYPMIDLDAALGPFNTPLPHNPEWEAAQRAAGNVGNKRRLHSAQMMKGFSGPGGHYHRRAESAPDLPPFDPGRSALHRFGSNSTMADVFEEEEEEEDDSEAKSDMADQSQQGEDSDGDTTPPARRQRTPSLPDIQDATPPTVRRKSSGLSDKDQAGVHSVRTERSRTSLQEDVIVEELPSVIFRTANMFQGGNDTYDRPLSSPRKTAGPKDGLPVDVNTIHIPGSVPMPTSPYSMSHASSYPSPRSPMSVDAQRISTAPSSVDENSFHSLLMGEPGPEVRISVDYDIPSLTSSTSTMTRESSFIPNPRLSQPTLRDQRPMSVSSAAFGRRRSSLVSLSRLISSSHGERSKLSMEVRLDEPDGRKSRHSKTKRLGRMMQFWKPTKEDTAT